MAGTSSVKKNLMEELHCFPLIENGRINLHEFLHAASDLLAIVDSLGKLFNPVKYDMQGNIDKIKKNFMYDVNSCLLELILKEKSEGKNIGTDATLWLNRALMFFEITFEEILKELRVTAKEDIDMKKNFTTAYEGSVKKYHNWVVQQIFAVICKMSPTFPQLLSSLGLEDVGSFQSKMTEFTSSLHAVRESIDNFYKENNVM